MMRAGDLRHALVIEQVQESRDAMGGAVTTWVAFATVSGKFERSEGGEVFVGQQIHARVDAKATIRFLPGVDATMRVVFDSQPWNIVRVIDPDGTRQQHQLYLQSGLSDGG